MLALLFVVATTEPPTDLPSGGPGLLLVPLALLVLGGLLLFGRLVGRAPGDHRRDLSAYDGTSPRPRRERPRTEPHDGR